MDHLKRSTKTTLLIMAAGLGSRYGGDKQVDRLGPDGGILLEYSVFDAICAGFDKFVFVIKEHHVPLFVPICEKLRLHGKEAVTVFQDFSSIPKLYEIPAERTKPFGTVHAMLCAKDAICEKFALINADDFYGREAYVELYSSLRALGEDEASLITYKLKNTISASGSVTRAECNVENSVLINIIERSEIARDAEGVIRDRERHALDDDLPVSMNMWGFSPKIFELANSEFVKFLTNIKDGDLRAEYVIPTFVADMINAQKLSVKCAQTSSEWFGVTHREDRDEVVKKLTDLHASGVYPDNLDYSKIDV